VSEVDGGGGDGGDGGDGGEKQWPSGEGLGAGRNLCRQRTRISDWPIFVVVCAFDSPVPVNSESTKRLHHHSALSRAIVTHVQAPSWAPSSPSPSSPRAPIGRRVTTSLVATTTAPACCNRLTTPTPLCARISPSVLADLPAVQLPAAYPADLANP